LYVRRSRLDVRRDLGEGHPLLGRRADAGLEGDEVERVDQFVGERLGTGVPMFPPPLARILDLLRRTGTMAPPRTRVETTFTG
jgi:hypothetical protein